MKSAAWLLFVVRMFVTTVSADPLPVVGIQPLGPVKPEYARQIKAGIEALYAVTVQILPEKPLPEAAYYKPRDRYKADDIIDTLANEMPEGIRKVIGFTVRDISTTNDDGKDWGIFGLGALGGKACVVSSFRLRAGKADEKLFQARLVKVVNHELGHTFGLDHCEVRGCVMQAAGGKISTVDAETGRPCAACSARLPLARQPPSDF